MIATLPSVGRAVSIATVLAALAFVHHGMSTADDPTPTIRITAVSFDAPDVHASVPAMETMKPYLDGHWQGACRGNAAGWPDMPIALDLSLATDGHMTASGTLAFVGRRTRAELRGSLWDGHFRLHGTMTEVGGLGTVWQIELRGETERANRLSGRFIEIVADPYGNASMCHFDWQR